MKKDTNVVEVTIEAPAGINSQTRRPPRRYTVDDSWAQSGGGTRYAVVTNDGYTISVDEYENGDMTACVRGTASQYTDRLLRSGAIRAVKNLNTGD